MSVQKGLYLNKVTFRETEAELSTDVQFDEMLDDGHHVGVPVATRYRIRSVAINAINDNIMECQKYLPKEFLR